MYQGKHPLYIRDPNTDIFFVFLHFVSNLSYVDVFMYLDGYIYVMHVSLGFD